MPPFVDAAYGCVCISERSTGAHRLAAVSGVVSSCGCSLVSSVQLSTSFSTIVEFAEAVKTVVESVRVFSRRLWSGNGTGDVARALCRSGDVPYITLARVKGG